MRVITKLLLIISFVLSGGSPIWASSLTTIDVSGNNENPTFYEELDGEWMFFHKEFLMPEHLENRLNDGTGIRIELPHLFEEHFEDSMTFGTYVAKVRIPAHYVGKTIAIYNPFQNGSYKLYADQTLISLNGKAGMNEQLEQAEMAPKVGYFEVDTNEFLVVIQLSNFHSISGGFINTPKIGDSTIVTERYNSSVISHFFVSGSIFVMGIFTFLLAYFYKNERTSYLFALFCFVVSVRSIFAVPYFYTTTIVSMPWEWGIRIDYSCTVIASVIYFIIILEWYKEYCKKWVFYAGIALSTFLLVLTLFTEPVTFQYWVNTLFNLMIVPIGYMIFMSIKVIRSRNKVSLVSLIGLGSIAIGAINDFLILNNYYQGPMIILPTVGIFVLTQVVVMSRNYANKIHETDTLNKALMVLTSSLDEKVNLRTQELQVANEKLLTLATKDALTGIANRHTFNMKIQEHFAYHKQQQLPLSLLMLDLDSFKTYNDYYGHIYGDELLQKVVMIIEQALPSEATFARYGGEEFAVILAETTREDAYKLGEKIVRTVHDARLEHLGQEIGIVTISVGGATMTAEDAYNSPSEFINVADQQLYKSKNHGRNQCTMQYNSIA